MLTVMSCLGAVMAIDTVLAADARLAMKRADLTLDYVSRVTGVPPQRLSDQLNGKTPFTSFWRLWTGEMRETDFRMEFLDIQADRVNRALVRADVGALISKLDALVGDKPMRRMELPAIAKQEQAS